MRLALASVSGAALAFAVGVTGPAWGQDQSSRDQGEARSAESAFPEVVVTAERRRVDLQETPIAATVLRGNELASKAVVSLEDLQRAAPAVSVQGSQILRLVNIRGIGLNSASPLVVPGIANYREGLWQPPIANTDSLYDIADVQVLRGPQGTFVGSNSTGGAILITSNNPIIDGGVHGYLEAKVGNYSNYGAQGAVNLPVSDQVAGRFALHVESRDSFYEQIGMARASDPGSLDELNGRLSLLWEPSVDLTILFKSETNYRDIGGYPTNPAPGTIYAPFAPDDPFTLDYDTNETSDILGNRNSLQIDWDILGSGTILRSISGYQYIRTNDFSDIDSTSANIPFVAIPVPPFAAPFAPRQSANVKVIERPISQELNLISPDAGRFKWILGAFYLHDTRKLNVDSTTTAIPSSVTVRTFTTLEAAAVFGQASFDLTESLQIEGGLRYTHDQSDNRAGDFLLVVTPAPPVPTSQVGSASDNVLTGKVAINYRLNDSNFFYAFAARGSKAGGFNPGLGNFQPEFVWDYELGWKANTFDNHLRTQLGIFYNDYSNLQVAAINTVTGANSTRNIAESTIKGIEASGQGIFGDWAFDFGAAYVESKLGSLTLVDTRLPGYPFAGAVNLGPQCVGGAAPPACFDYTPFLRTATGEPNPYSPLWTANAGAEYTFHVQGTDTLIPRINYSFVSAQWASLLHTHPETDRISSRGLWNAQLTYHHGDWRVVAYGTNLLDKRYIAGQFTAGASTVFQGAPQQYGVRISRDF